MVERQMAHVEKDSGLVDGEVDCAGIIFTKQNSKETRRI